MTSSTNCILVALLFASGCAMTMTDQQLAAKHAQADIGNGQLVLMDVGMVYPDAWTNTYYELLDEEYGIQHGKSDAVSWNRSDTYRAAYNEVVEREIERQFGADVFTKTRKSALAQWEAKHGPWDPLTQWKTVDEP